MIIQWQDMKAVAMQAGGLHLTILHNKEDMDVRVFRRNTSLGRKNKYPGASHAVRYANLRQLQIRMHSEWNATVTYGCNFLPSDIPYGNNYPSGTTMAESPRRTDQDFQPYKFTGKELDRFDTMNFYDFEARTYDPTLMRFTGIDPLAEKYPSISPYVYCNNNPVRFTDPTGMEFTDAAWKQVNRLIADIDKRQAKNTEDIAKKQAQIDAGGLSNKKVASLQKDINKLSSNSTELEGVRGEVATLAGSSQVYDIYSDNSMNISGAIPGMGEDRSGAVFNFSNGNFDIKLGDGSLGSLAHELKHAYQFETGAFSSGPQGLPFYDQSDEVAAYARGAFFGGQSRSASSIASDPLYSKLPVGPIDATNHPNIMHLLNNPAALQKMVNTYQKSGMAFRINGVTYRTGR